MTLNYVEFRAGLEPRRVQGKQVSRQDKQQHDHVPGAGSAPHGILAADLAYEPEWHARGLLEG